MASAPPEDYQLTISTLSAALSNLSAPSALQRDSAYSLDVNADALSEFDADAYAEIDWKHLLGYHIPHTTSTCRTGDAWKHGYERWKGGK